MRKEPCIICAARSEVKESDCDCEPHGNHMRKILIATTNPGKLRDFAGAAAPHGIEIASIPNFASLPTVVEDGLTFEENARKKAEQYSRYAPGNRGCRRLRAGGRRAPRRSGRPLRALRRRPASSRRRERRRSQQRAACARTQKLPPEKRTGRFVCVLSAARDGRILATFRGTAEGVILGSPRGTHGFGYDPLFYFPQIQKSFAELTAEEKARYSHRGAAFRKFLHWCDGLAS